MNEGKFIVEVINPAQFRITRSDRPGYFIVSQGYMGLLPEGAHPTFPASIGDYLESWLKFSEEETKRIKKGVKGEIPDSDPRAKELWGFWKSTEAEESQ